MDGFRVGSVSGIPVQVNWTLLLVLPVFVALIATDVGQLVESIDRVFASDLAAAELDRGLLPWALGLASVLGLFVGVFLHELGHSAVAMRYGYEIDAITLWLLGGVATFTEFPDDWRHELWIAVAGPAVSVAVGAVGYAAFLLTPSASAAVRFVFAYLALLNVVLAGFNLLPGFPMDGGRILRALLARSRPHAVATRQAARVGKGFAVLLGLLGAVRNVFLLLLAIFIYFAAASEAKQTTIDAAFEGVAVRDVMTGADDLETVREDTSVAALIERMFRQRHVGYPVVSDGRLVGMVTLEDAAEVDEVERPAFEVRDVMSTEVETVAPDVDARTALRRLQQAGVGRLPVVDERGDLVGILSRTDLMRAVEIIRTGGRPPEVPDATTAGADRDQSTSPNSS